MKIDEGKLDAAAERLKFDIFQGSHVGLDHERLLRDWLRKLIESVQDDAPPEEWFDLALPWNVRPGEGCFVRNVHDYAIVDCLYGKNRQQREVIAAYIVRAANGYRKAVPGLFKIRDAAIKKAEYQSWEMTKEILKDLGEPKE